MRVCSDLGERLRVYGITQTSHICAFGQLFDLFETTQKHLELLCNVM